jgi:hypothetical protein
MQVEFPVNTLSFPATHAAHGPPFGPVNPVLQMQLVKDVLPESAKVFDGQSMHVEIDEAPTAEEYL